MLYQKKNNFWQNKASYKFAVWACSDLYSYWLVEILLFNGTFPQMLGSCSGWTLEWTDMRFLLLFLHKQRINGRTHNTWLKRLHVYMWICLHCVSKKVPTFKLSVTLSNLNRFSKFVHCWKSYEICYKTHMTSPTSPHVATIPSGDKKFKFLQIFSRYGRKCKHIGF